VIVWWLANSLFEDGDREVYRDLLAEQTRKAGVKVGAWFFPVTAAYLLQRMNTRDGE
jgi:hypothetical protein